MREMMTRLSELSRTVKWIVVAPLILALFALFVALGGVVVRELWDWLLPSLFGWRAITFWEALGLLLLCRILFGGLGGRGGTSHRLRRRWEARWDERWAERWAAMTPEERERFRHGLGGRGGDAPPAGAGGDTTTKGPSRTSSSSGLEC
jgi:hypothetical protein